MSRLLRSPIALIVYVPAIAFAQGITQQGSPVKSASPNFAAADALDINAFSAGDLSDDGKWLVLTQSVRRDAYGTDYRHDGDPTYVKPTPIRMWVVDAHSGQRTPIFADKKAVRGGQWSADGNQLAFLIWNGDVFEPAVWSRATGKVDRKSVV